MVNTSSDLFRFVSLRGPSDGLTVDPSAIVRSSVVLKLLDSVSVDVTEPGREVLDRLADLPLLDDPALRALALYRRRRSASAEGYNEICRCNAGGRDDRRGKGTLRAA